MTFDNSCLTEQTRWGKLSLVEKLKGRFWKFKCDCGNECLKVKYEVFNGKVKSCGCNNARRFSDEERKQRAKEASHRQYHKDIEKSRAYNRLADQKRKEKRKEYHRKHQARRAAYQKTYWSKNKERFQVEGLKYRMAHREELKHYAIRYRHAHSQDSAFKLRVKASGSKSYFKHKSQLLAKHKQWRAKNQDRVAFYRHQRRLLESNAVLNLEEIMAWMKSVKAKAFARCYHCDKRISTKKIHFDHIVPLIKGGEHSLRNLCVSCSDCNLRKGQKTIRLWVKTGQQLLEL